MVKYRPDDVIPMEQFEFSWRITDPRWARLPDEMLARITPLTTRKSRELFEKSHLNLPSGMRRSAKAVRSHSLVDSGEPRCDARIKGWFEKLPIDARKEVYLCWASGGGVAAITDWGTFTETWGDLWFPFDRLCVFDESGEWAVLFGPEESVSFLTSSSIMAAT